MNRVRKDARGRILRIGEDQMPDGRYRFRYSGPEGERNAVYSWQLIPSDRTPAGKRQTVCLRDMEKVIAAEKEDGIDGKMSRSITLDQMFLQCIGGNPSLKASTRSNYLYMYSTYIGPTLGRRSIASIRYSDVRAFYVRMITSGVQMRDSRTGQYQQSRPFRVSSMDMIQAILHPVFDLAVRDGCIRSNPSDGVMRELKQSAVGRRKKRGLTEKEQAVFVAFIARTPKYQRWMPLVTVFLGTGLRVGELLGLCWEDCDFENNTISVNHSLIYRRLDGGKCQMHVTTPKTVSGCRTVPMLSEVRRALLLERERQERDGPCEITVDGRSGFIFQNQLGRLHNPSGLNRELERIRKACNRDEEKRAQLDGREPVVIPHLSAHTYRHTFCMRFCENETNVKMIQAIMGHADIATTMNIYADATEEKKKETMENLEGKIRIC